MTVQSFLPMQNFGSNQSLMSSFFTLSYLRAPARSEGIDILPFLQNIGPLRWANRARVSSRHKRGLPTQRRGWRRSGRHQKPDRPILSPAPDASGVKLVKAIGIDADEVFPVWSMVIHAFPSAGPSGPSPSGRCAHWFGAAQSNQVPRPEFRLFHRLAKQRLRHHLCRKFVDLAPAHDHMPGTFRTAVNSVLLRRVVGKGRGGRRVFAEHQAVAGPVAPSEAP